jgi:hypothetical protein
MRCETNSKEPKPVAALRITRRFAKLLLPQCLRVLHHLGRRLYRLIQHGRGQPQPRTAVSATVATFPSKQWTAVSFTGRDLNGVASLTSLRFLLNSTVDDYGACNLIYYVQLQ